MQSEEDLEAILTADVHALLSVMVRKYRAEVEAVVQRRPARQARFDSGYSPSFLPDSRAIRADPTWRVAPSPPDLHDRRVELTGPVDRKSIINGLNSGANVFMADFEDATSPLWSNILEGQRNLRDAVRRTIGYESPDTGRQYFLNARPATLVVRPRGWHLEERHYTVDGSSVPAPLFNVVVYAATNARELVCRGSAPYFYLPKLESHIEARLWARVLMDLEDALELRRGTVKATVLIETLPAAFEMDEILFELRNHVVGLNCGRWDYIFSAVKTRRRDPRFILPDRAQITMDTRFMRAYARLLIATCHRRGAHAIGGMAAQIPLRDPIAHAAAMERVRLDKSREVHAGHDGTWVAHPGLVHLAREIFDAAMPWAHQLNRVECEPPVLETDLLAVPSGVVTEEGIRHNIRVAVQCLASWLAGNGCVPLYGLMEDVATAEISRVQVWQWLRHEAELADGRTVTRPLVQTCLEEEVSIMAAETLPYLKPAVEIVEEVLFGEELCEFMTVPAYARLEEKSIAPSAPV